MNNVFARHIPAAIISAMLADSQENPISYTGVFAASYFSMYHFFGAVKDYYAKVDPSKYYENMKTRNYVGDKTGQLRLRAMSASRKLESKFEKLNSENKLTRFLDVSKLSENPEKSAFVRYLNKQYSGIIPKEYFSDNIKEINSLFSSDVGKKVSKKDIASRVDNNLAETLSRKSSGFFTKEEVLERINKRRLAYRVINKFMRSKNVDSFSINDLFHQNINDEFGDELSKEIRAILGSKASLNSDGKTIINLDSSDTLSLTNDLEISDKSSIIDNFYQNSPDGEISIQKKIYNQTSKQEDIVTKTLNNQQKNSSFITKEEELSETISALLKGIDTNLDTLQNQLPKEQQLLSAERRSVDFLRSIGISTSEIYNEFLQTKKDLENQGKTPSQISEALSNLQEKKSNQQQRLVYVRNENSLVLRDIIGSLDKNVLKILGDSKTSKEKFKERYKDLDNPTNDEINQLRKARNKLQSSTINNLEDINIQALKSLGFDASIATQFNYGGFYFNKKYLFQPILDDAGQIAGYDINKESIFSHIEGEYSTDATIELKKNKPFNLKFFDFELFNKTMQNFNIPVQILEDEIKSFSLPTDTNSLKQQIGINATTSDEDSKKLISAFVNKRNQYFNSFITQRLNTYISSENNPANLERLTSAVKHFSSFISAKNRNSLKVSASVVEPKYQPLFQSQNAEKDLEDFNFLVEYYKKKGHTQPLEAERKATAILNLSGRKISYERIETDAGDGRTNKIDKAKIELRLENARKVDISLSQENDTFKVGYSDEAGKYNEFKFNVTQRSDDPFLGSIDFNYDGHNSNAVSRFAPLFKLAREDYKMNVDMSSPIESFMPDSFLNEIYEKTQAAINGFEYDAIGSPVGRVYISKKFDNKENLELATIRAMLLGEDYDYEYKEYANGRNNKTVLDFFTSNDKVKEIFDVYDTNRLTDQNKDSIKAELEKIDPSLNLTTKEAQEYVDNFLEEIKRINKDNSIAEKKTELKKLKSPFGQNITDQLVGGLNTSRFVTISSKYKKEFIETETFQEPIVDDKGNVTYIEKEKKVLSFRKLQDFLARGGLSKKARYGLTTQNAEEFISTFFQLNRGILSKEEYDDFLEILSKSKHYTAETFVARGSDFSDITLEKIQEAYPEISKKEAQKITQELNDPKKLKDLKIKYPKVFSGTYSAFDRNQTSKSIFSHQFTAEDKSAHLSKIDYVNRLISEATEGTTEAQQMLHSISASYKMPLMLGSIKNVMTISDYTPFSINPFQAYERGEGMLLHREGKRLKPTEALIEFVKSIRDKAAVDPLMSTALDEFFQNTNMYNRMSVDPDTFNDFSKKLGLGLVFEDGQSLFNIGVAEEGSEVFGSKKDIRISAIATKVKGENFYDYNSSVLNDLVEAISSALENVDLASDPEIAQFERKTKDNILESIIKQKKPIKSLIAKLKALDPEFMTYSSKGKSLAISKTNMQNVMVPEYIDKFDVKDIKFGDNGFFQFVGEGTFDPKTEGLYHKLFGVDVKTGGVIGNYGAEIAAYEGYSKGLFTIDNEGKLLFTNPNNSKVSHSITFEEFKANYTGEKVIEGDNKKYIRDLISELKAKTENIHIVEDIKTSGLDKVFGPLFQKKSNVQNLHGELSDAWGKTALAEPFVLTEEDIKEFGEHVKKLYPELSEEQKKEAIEKIKKLTGAKDSDFQGSSSDSIQKQIQSILDDTSSGLNERFKKLLSYSVLANIESRGKNSQYLFHNLLKHVASENNTSDLQTLLGLVKDEDFYLQGDKTQRNVGRIYNRKDMLNIIERNIGAFIEQTGIKSSGIVAATPQLSSAIVGLGNPGDASWMLQEQILLSGLITLNNKDGKNVTVEEGKERMANLLDYNYKYNASYLMEGERLITGPAGMLSKGTFNLREVARLVSGKPNTRLYENILSKINSIYQNEKLSPEERKIELQEYFEKKIASLESRDKKVPKKMKELLNYLTDPETHTVYFGMEDINSRKGLMALPMALVSGAYSQKTSINKGESVIDIEPKLEKFRKEIFSLFRSRELSNSETVREGLDKQIDDKATEMKKFTSDVISKGLLKEVYKRKAMFGAIKVYQRGDPGLFKEVTKGIQKFYSPTLGDIDEATPELVKMADRFVASTTEHDLHLMTTQSFLENLRNNPDQSIGHPTYEAMVEDIKIAKANYNTRLKTKKKIQNIDSSKNYKFSQEEEEFVERIKSGGGINENDKNLISGILNEIGVDEEYIREILDRKEPKYFAILETENHGAFLTPIVNYQDYNLPVTMSVSRNPTSGVLSETLAMVAMPLESNSLISDDKAIYTMAGSLQFFAAKTADADFDPMQTNIMLGFNKRQKLVDSGNNKIGEVILPKINTSSLNEEETTKLEQAMSGMFQIGEAKNRFMKDYMPLVSLFSPKGSTGSQNLPVEELVSNVDVKKLVDIINKNIAAESGATVKVASPTATIEMLNMLEATVRERNYLQNMSVEEMAGSKNIINMKLTDEDKYLQSSILYWMQENVIKTKHLAREEFAGKGIVTSASLLQYYREEYIGIGRPTDEQRKKYVGKITEVMETVLGGKLESKLEALGNITLPKEINVKELGEMTIKEINDLLSSDQYPLTDEQKEFVKLSSYSQKLKRNIKFIAESSGKHIPDIIKNKETTLGLGQTLSNTDNLDYPAMADLYEKASGATNNDRILSGTIPQSSARDPKNKLLPKANAFKKAIQSVFKRHPMAVTLGGVALLGAAMSGRVTGSNVVGPGVSDYHDDKSMRNQKAVNGAPNVPYIKQQNLYSTKEKYHPYSVNASVSSQRSNTEAQLDRVVNGNNFSRSDVNIYNY